MTDERLNRIIHDAAEQGAPTGFGPGFVARTVAAAQDSAAQDSAARDSAARKPTAGRPASGLATERAPRPGRLGGRTFRLTLAATILVGAFALIEHARLRTAFAPEGASVATRLPDGSSIVLGPGSSITYRSFLLRDRREVRLTGEAFFDVAPKSRPFVVETFNTAIWVTGTRFNVRGWASDRSPETVVSLEEGRVTVFSLSAEGPPGPDPVRLVPGEAVRVSSGGATKDERISVSDAMNWQQGGFSLIDVPLSDALAQIARRFGLRIEVDQGIANRPTTYVAPTANSAEDALDAICFALNLRYSRVLDGYRIESPIEDLR
jgi:ferric-dicitrate binding protein FerR (iron transport regulator)